jgi:hypothetical protein
MSNKRKLTKGRVVENHEHIGSSANGHGGGGLTQREPNAFTIIRNLNKSLDQRANEVRQLQDREVYLIALIEDLESENTGLKAGIDQITAENRVLRKRLGLDEVGVVDLTDAE